MIPEPQASGTGSVVIYDLSDADAWQQAAEDWEMWGRSCSELHALDSDHLIIEFKARDTLETT